MRISIDLDAGPVLRTLQRLEDKLSNLAPVFRGIGADAVAEAQLRFRESRDPYGVAWKPLSFASRLARARRAAGKKATKKDGTLKAAAGRRFVGAFSTAKPLLDTGRLRNSVTFRSGADFAEIGTNVAYGAIHQFGGKAGRGRRTTIPARTFLATKQRGLPREYAEIIREQITLHLRGTLAGGGR